MYQESQSMFYSRYERKKRIQSLISLFTTIGAVVVVLSLLEWLL
jgi:hypothetical protein